MEVMGKYPWWCHISWREMWCKERKCRAVDSDQVLSEAGFVQLVCVCVCFFREG